MRVKTGQAYDRFITLPGVMPEELTLLTETGVELVSMGKAWPQLTITTSHGVIKVPDLLVL